MALRPLSPSRSERRASAEAGAADGSHGARRSFTPGMPAGIPHKKKVFIDAAAMKEELKKNIYKPRYDVMEYYHTEGWCQHIARHSLFESITLVVIGFNALWISIDIDWNTADVLSDAHPVFIAAENLFALFFSLELGIRFGAFESKRNCLKDAWFVFDALMVAIMAFETWVVALIWASLGGGKGLSLGNATLVRMLRLLRITRVARMARLLRSMPEILILIKGMVAAIRSVFFTLLLLVVLLYIFGILFKQLSMSTQTGDSYFSTVPRSMNQLIIHGVFFDNFGDLVESIVEEESTGTAVVLLTCFYLFVLLATLTVMNMLIGVLCEVVSAVAETEHESLAISYVKDNLWTFVQDLGDEDGNNVRITKKDFIDIVKDLNAARLLKAVEVDLFAVIDIVDAIFDAEGSDEERSLTFPEFIEVLLEHRSTADATVKDITDLRKYIRQRAERTDTELGYKMSSVEAHVEAMSSAIASATQGSLGAEDDHGRAHAEADGGSSAPRTGRARTRARKGTRKLSVLSDASRSSQASTSEGPPPLGS